MSKYSIIFQRQANYVEHRTVGHIPNCVPAVDIFVERTLDEVHTMLATDGYQQVWDNYCDGVIGWNEWLNHPIHKRIPYSPFRNPAPKGEGNLYM